jgi:hypothetical protein
MPCLLEVGPLLPYLSHLQAEQNPTTRTRISLESYHVLMCLPAGHVRNRGGIVKLVAWLLNHI